MVEFIYGKDSIQRLQVNNVVGVGDPAVCEFVETCTPENPIYLRWINRLGGWDYQMLSADEFTKETSNVTTFRPYLRNTINHERGGTLRTQIPISLEPGESVTAGCKWDGLTEYRKLANIIYSPEIHYWNVRLQKWLGVWLDRHSITKQAGNKFGEFEIDITLPDPFIQF